MTSFFVQTQVFFLMENPLVCIENLFIYLISTDVFHLQGLSSYFQCMTVGVYVHIFSTTVLIVS